MTRQGRVRGVSCSAAERWTHRTGLWDGGAVNDRIVAFLSTCAGNDAHSERECVRVKERRGPLRRVGNAARGPRVACWFEQGQRWRGALPLRPRRRLWLCITGGGRRVSERAGAGWLEDGPTGARGTKQAGGRLGDAAPPVAQPPRVFPRPQHTRAAARAPCIFLLAGVSPPRGAGALPAPARRARVRSQPRFVRCTPLLRPTLGHSTRALQRECERERERRLPQRRLGAGAPRVSSPRPRRRLWLACTKMTGG